MGGWGVSRSGQVLGARPESIPDYYAIVGVRRGADTAELKKVPGLNSGAATAAAAAAAAGVPRRLLVLGIGCRRVCRGRGCWR